MSFNRELPGNNPTSAPSIGSVDNMTEDELTCRLTAVRQIEDQISHLHTQKANYLQGIFPLDKLDIIHENSSSYLYHGINRLTNKRHLYTIRSLGQKDLGDLRTFSFFLQSQWGTDHPEATDTELVTILDLGGLLLGVYDQDYQLVGASQMLAGYDSQLVTSLIADQTVVENKHRDFGLGKALKHVTFDKLIDRGMTRLYMTFDPQRANLWGLNVGRLGARVIDFVANKYGGGLVGTFNTEDKPTDRVVGLYDLTDPVLIAKVLSLPYQAYLPNQDELTTATISFEDSWAGVEERTHVLGSRLKDQIVVDFTRNQELIFARRDSYNSFYLRKAD